MQRVQSPIGCDEEKPQAPPDATLCIYRLQLRLGRVP